MTEYLLDTHVLLWAAGAPERLDDAVLTLLSDPRERVVVSAVSIAEMAIKIRLGKLSLPGSPGELVAGLDLATVGLTAAEAERLLDLPTLHRDPFDRLLVAQAINADRVLITADPAILQYPDVRLLRA